MSVDLPLRALAASLVVLGTASPAAAAAPADPVVLLADGRPASTPAPDAERPDAATCAALRPDTVLAPTGTPSADATLRTVGLQAHLDLADSRSYETFAVSQRCLVEDLVVPLLRPGLPTLVVFDEDAGLVTVATGARGDSARELAAAGLDAPVGDGAPVGVAVALGQLATAYSPQIAAYTGLLGPVDPRKATLLAATDTFARAFSATYADIARDYGVHVVSGNNQARYRASSDPAEIAAFGDPELLAAGGVDEVYVATDSRVPNTTFLWGPDEVDPTRPAGGAEPAGPQREGPADEHRAGPARGSTRALRAAPRPSTTPRPVQVAGLSVGFATSLPAFQFGYPFGERPADLEPCADVRVTWMACLDSLGTEVVVQADANPGRWAADAGSGAWQPLEWATSTQRAVTDPSVSFRYVVNPFLVGNLLDLGFDGQSNITARTGGEPGRFIGNAAEPGDPAELLRYTGDSPVFLALAPWAAPDGPRAGLRETSAALAPGSGDPREDDYPETAVWADLVTADAATGPDAPDPVVPESPAAVALPLLALAAAGAAAARQRARRREA